LEASRTKKLECTHFQHAPGRPYLGCYCCEVAESDESDLKWTVWKDLVNRRYFDYNAPKEGQIITDQILGITLTGVPFFVANNKKDVDPLYPNQYGRAMTIPDNR